MELTVFPGLRRATFEGETYDLVATRTIPSFNAVGEWTGADVQYFMACGGNATSIIGAWVTLRHGVSSLVSDEPEALERDAFIPNGRFI